MYNYSKALVRYGHLTYVYYSLKAVISTHYNNNKTFNKFPGWALINKINIVLYKFNATLYLNASDGTLLIPFIHGVPVV